MKIIYMPSHTLHTSCPYHIISHEGLAPDHDRLANKTGPYIRIRELCRLMLQICTMHGQLYVTFLITSTLCVACHKSTCYNADKCLWLLHIGYIAFPDDTYYHTHIEHDKCVVYIFETRRVIIQYSDYKKISLL
jgi:hypothetical protein